MRRRRIGLTRDHLKHALLSPYSISHSYADPKFSDVILYISKTEIIPIKTDIATRKNKETSGNMPRWKPASNDSFY